MRAVCNGMRCGLQIEAKGCSVFHKAVEARSLFELQWACDRGGYTECSASIGVGSHQAGAGNQRPTFGPRLTATRGGSRPRRRGWQHSDVASLAATHE